MNNFNADTNLKNGLTNLAASNSMSFEEMSQFLNMLQERQAILSHHKSPISQNPNDKRWRTRLPNGKQIVKTRKEDLEDAIIAYYREFPNVPQTTNPFTGSHCTLKTLYPRWLEQRKKDVCKSTLADDIGNWTRYIASSEISDIPLQNLSTKMLKNWATQLLNGHPMKRKYFNNIKSVLNSLLDYAVGDDIIEVNKFRHIKLNKNLFQPPTPKADYEEVFSEHEEKLVMDEAERDSNSTHSAIPLGICILFLTGLRVGELCALHYGDIKGEYLYVRRMMIEKQVETPDGQMKWNGYEIVDHTKSSAGTRVLPLTKQAQDYFAKIRSLNMDNGFSVSPNALIFQRKKKGMCTPKVFDTRIKKYCRHLELPFEKSCHDIRRSYITSLFDLGINIATIKRLAGHEQVEMTMNYSRGRKALAELADLLERRA